MGDHFSPYNRRKIFFAAELKLLKLRPSYSYFHPNYPIKQVLRVRLLLKRKVLGKHVMAHPAHDSSAPEAEQADRQRQISF